MTPFEIGFIGLAILFLLIICGMPIGFSMGLVGFIGCVSLKGLKFALFQIKTVPFTTFNDSYTMACIPLFVLMGELCYSAGISSELYTTVHRWMGRLRGGLAMATVGACAGFAAVSGSSAATVATMGTVALPEMKKYKYDPALSTGAIAAGGGLGILIPPSIILVIYGIFADQSIGKLFLAGFIPGILQAFLFMVTIYFLCKMNPHLGPPAEPTTLREKIISLKYTWPVVLLFFVVMGSIYSGITTPTEASGFGAFVAFLLALIRKKLSRKAFLTSLMRTIQTTAFILFIVMGAVLFRYFLTLSRVPNELAGLITQLELNRYIIMFGIMVMYIFLGCIMEGLSILLLTVPVIMPIIMELGFDPIWYGIIMVTVVEMGLITPPVGINVFIIHGVAKDVPLSTIFRGVFLFFVADVFHIALLVVFPISNVFTQDI